MSSSYRDDLMCFECELELIETYEKFKGDSDYDEDGRRMGMTELNNLEIKFGKAFLKKRIAWLETKIEEEEKEQYETR